MRSKSYASLQASGLVHVLFVTALFILGEQSASAQTTPQFFNNNNGASSNAFPLNTSASNKVQWIYGPAVFNSNGTGGGAAAYNGNITKVWFRFGAATATYANFTISLGQNVGTQGSYGTVTTSGVAFNTGLTQCFFQSSYALTTIAGWNSVTLQTPFLYDPSLGLVIELKVSSTVGAQSLQVSNASNMQRLYAAYGASTGTINSGLIDFGFDLVPAIPCTSPPTPGTATATPSSGICTGANILLNLSGNSIGSGQTYQWQSATSSGGPYTNLGTSSAAATLNTPATSTLYYRCQVTCSGNTQTSTSVLVSVNPSFPAGTYTINSAVATGGTNYQTFTAAVNALSCGIAGPVVFNVVAGSGPYTEQISVPAIGGTSAVNTITINGNNCTLTFAATLSTAPSTLELNGTDYMIINNLIITGTGATYAYACHLWNQADNNAFNNCTFNCPANSSAITTHVPFSISGSQTSATTTGVAGINNVITGCTMNSGYYNTAIVGNGTTGSTGNQVINCNIRDQYLYGMYIYYQNGAIIQGNTVERPTRTTLSTFYGIYVTTGCTNVKVDGNRIQNPFGAAITNTNTAYGIYTPVVATAGNENIIKNNLIQSFNSSGAVYGIYEPSYGYNKYYHNTIAFDQTAATGTTTTYGIYAYGSTTDIRNNIVTIRRGGTGTKYCIYIGATTGVTCNYNDLYLNAAAGTNYFGYNGSTSALTFAAWQATGFDLNSKNVDPLYVSPGTGDYTPTNGLVNNAATPVGVLTDINGTARSTTTPDIGAYEFTVGGLDASIAYVSPTSPSTVGLKTITVNITNTQSTTITDLNLAYNDGGGPVTQAFSGLNILGGTNQNLSFTTQYNLVNSVTMTVSILSVNGGSDAVSGNNTATYGLCVGLNGTYTINSAVATGGTNYQTFAAAIAALNCGIAGPVIFNVASGSGPYNEQVTINQITNATSVNTITINGNNCTLTFNSTNSAAPSTIELNGTDYLRINNLIVNAQGATYAFALHLWNQADNNIFTNCTFNCPANGSSTTQVPFSVSGSQTSATTTGAAGNGNVITGCTMFSGYYNTCLVGNTSPSATGNQVINCNLRDFYYYGMYTYYQNGAIIRGNTIERTTRTTLGYYYGVYLTTGCTNVVVDKNRLRNPFGAATTQTSNYAYCIYDVVAATSGNENKITNNIISGLNSGYYIYCMYLSGANYTKVYHNTINCLDAASTSTATIYGIYNSGTTGTDIRNNIIDIRRGGTGVKYCIYMSSAAAICNYNDIYINSPAGTNYIAYSGSTALTYSTLAAWQATGYDVNSYSMDPGYFNAAGNNFKPTAALLDNNGTPVGVSDDITGALRSPSTPDIGAYEFNVSPKDVGVFAIVGPNASGCYTNAETFVVTIKNYGTQTLNYATDPVTVNCDITGQITQTVTGTISSGTLAIGGTQNVALSPTVDGTANGNYTINAYTLMAADGDNSNDGYPTVTIPVGPVAGTVTSSIPSACNSGSPILTAAGVYGGAIQWQSSTTSASGPWINVGTNSATYSPGSVNQTTYYQALTVCNTNSATSNVATVTVATPVLTSTTPGSRCGYGSVVLGATASAGNTVSWYANATGGAALGTGNSFTTPALSSTTNYYAEAGTGVGIVPGLGCTLVPTASGFNAARGIQFNAYSDFTITSFDTYFAYAGAVTCPIVLQNSSGATLWSGTASLTSPSATAGWHTFTVSIPVTAGTGYKLLGGTWTGSTSNYSHSSGADYSNTAFNNLGAVGIITNGLDFGPVVTTTAYYYFYNITVAAGCASARTAVAANINTAPLINVVASDPAVCPGGSTQISVNSLNDPSYTYAWTSNPSGYTNSGAGPFTVSPTITTKYIVTATDNTAGPNAGCVAVDSVAVIAAASLVAGTASASQTNYCVSGSPTLVLTGSDGGATQWQKSTVSSSGPWTNVGTNNTTYNAGTITQTTYYQAITSCQTSSVTSNVVTVNVNSPQLASTTPGSRCGTGTVNLSATGAGGATVNWYNAATGGTQVANGNSFTTPVISNTTTYYAAASQGGTNSPMSLMTTNAAGNGAYGNLFDINILNQVRIDSFAIYAVTAGTNFGIYYRTGTGTGFNTSSTGWTLIGSGTISTINSVPANFTVIPLNVNLTLTPGLYSFAISTSVTVNYSNGTAVGNNFATDANIEIKEGYGGSSTYPTFGFTNSPRVFNGRVYYTASLACESNRVPVVATVTPPPTIAVSPTQTTCSNVSKTLTVSSPNDPNYNYTWNPGSLSGSSVVVNPSATTTYTVTATDPVTQCVNQGTVLVNVNPAPTAPTVTPSSVLLCEDDTVKLKASGSSTAYVATVGNGTTVNAITAYPSPYGLYYGSDQLQMLIPASELTASGMLSGNINSISFNQSVGYTYGAMPGYTIQMANTNLTTLSGLVTTGFSTVYGPVTYTPPATTGWTTINLTTPFYWNGSSNLIVDIWFSNCSVCNGTSSCTTSFTDNGQVLQTSSLSYNASYDVHADNNCTINSFAPSTTGTLYTQRPNIRFNGGSQLSYTWSPVTDLFNDLALTSPYVAGTLKDSVYSHPSVTHTYTTTATLGSCPASTAVTVTIDVIPQVNITPAGPTSFCPGSNVTLNASTDPTYTSYAWTPGGPSGSAATSFTVGGATNTTTTYRITATGAGGCTSHQDISIHVHDTIPPSVIVIGNTNLCTGQTTSDLQADISGPTGPAQSYSWSTGETTSLITVSAAGTYYITTSDVHGCITHNSQAITESPAPAPPIITPAGPIDLCSFDFGATFNSITLTCNNYNSDLNWSNTETSQSITVDYADIFNVTYTDANGCFSVSNSVVTNGLLASDAPTGASSNAPFNNINLRVEHGQIVGLVGESGSGKSSLVSAMLALLPKSATIDGSILVDGKSLYAMNEREQRALRGRVVATVSQDPFTALNPVVTIGTQLVEFQHRLGDLSRAEKRERALAMLKRVGLSDPDARMRQYPHQLSGGIRQRVAIAAALLVGPKLLIADEPTTALDATTEAQIIDIIREMRGSVDGSIVFVTHDMGVVGELCDQVAVMYAGELVETGPVRQVFSNPKHPYTRALLKCDPARIETPTRHLPTISGTVPSPTALPPGCIFSTRCDEAFDRCRREKPILGPAISSGAACHLAASP